MIISHTCLRFEWYAMLVSVCALSLSLYLRVIISHICMRCWFSRIQCRIVSSVDTDAVVHVKWSTQVLTIEWTHRTCCPMRLHDVFFRLTCLMILNLLIYLCKRLRSPLRCCSIQLEVLSADVWTYLFCDTVRCRRILLFCLSDVMRFEWYAMLVFTYSILHSLSSRMISSSMQRVIISHICVRVLSDMRREWSLVISVFT